MASAPAAKKSRPRESRSSTTTASSAKDEKKTADAWSANDQLIANAQGWGVYECVDEKKLNVFFEIMSHGVRFKDDATARLFVNSLSTKHSDTRAAAAIKLVFKSKIGSTTRKKK